MNVKPVLSKRLIAFIVSLAGFMEALDTTIINTAIPAISDSLHVNPVDLKIALISYLVTLAIFIPISGWVSDKFGIKRVFILALVVFTLSSVWCGFANSLVQLVMARSAQGLGGSLMLPLGRLMLLRTFKRHELVDAMNQVITVISIGMMLGPLAGGFITDHFSWHWIFWVNIPVGLITIVMAAIWFEKAPPKHVHRFDWIGFILFGGGLAALTFSLSALSESGTNSHSSILILVISLLMLLNYFFYSRKQTQPIVNIALFRMHTFKISIVGNIVARLGFGGIPFLLPLLLQIGLGYTAVISGLLLAPIAIGVIVIKLLSLRILRLFGYRKTLLVNTLLVGGIILVFQVINLTTPVSVIALLTFIFGLLISMQFSAMNSLAYADIGPDDLSAATSIVSTTQQIAQSFGVAVAALLLYFYAPHIGDKLQLSPLVFHQTFFALGLLSFLSSLIFLRLRPNDGHQMLKPPPQES